MDIHKLRCIVSLARLRNVTRAAEENYIAQGTMSTTISAAESEIGFPLFVRTNRSVTLTQAGEIFVPMAEQVVGLYDRTLLAIRRLGDGSGPFLTIGFNEVTMGSSLTTILQKFRLAHPDVALRLCKHSLSKLARCLEDGSADIVFSNQFEARKNPRARYSVIAQTQPCVYVSKRHRLARRKVVTLGDLEGEALLCACLDDAPDVMSAAAEVLARGGVPYGRDGYIANEETIFSMVESGMGLYPASDWYQRAYGDRVACIPLEINVESMQIIIMWIGPEFDSLAVELASIARQVFSVASGSS